MREFDECPRCGNKIRPSGESPIPPKWISGVGFEDKIICCMCFYIFDPDELWEEERQYYNTFRE